MSDRRTRDEYEARRTIQDAGWKLDKTDKVEFNDGSETLRHAECKLRVAWYLRQQGYRVDSEVEGPDGQQVVSVYRWCNKNDESCAELDPAEHSRWLPER